MARTVGTPPFRTPLVNEKKETTEVWQRWIANLAELVRTVQYLESDLDPTSVAANTVERQTFTVTGLTTGDVVTVNPPALPAGLEILNARVTATDTLQITFWNSTGAPIDATSQTYTILAVRQ
jgi:hypothetical protein